MPLIISKKNKRPRFAYLKKDPDILYCVFELYKERVGVWHNPSSEGELPVIFFDLKDVDLIWSTTTSNKYRQY